MITFYDFNELDESGNAEVVFTDGVFVDDRDEDKWKVQLNRLIIFMWKRFMTLGQMKLPGMMHLRE